MITTLIIVRHLSINEFADYSFYLGISAIVSGFISNIINRYLIFSDAYNIIKYDYFWIVVVTFLIVPGVLFFEKGFVLMSFLISIHMVVFEAKKTYYQKKEDFSKFGMVQVFKSSILLVMILSLAMYEKINAPIALLCLTMSLLIVNFHNHSQIKLESISIFELVKQVFIDNRFLFFYFIIIPVMSQSSQWFLRFGVSTEEQGYFSIAFYIYSISMLIVASMKKVFISHLAKQSTEKSVIEIKKITQKITAIALILSIGIWLSLPLIEVILNKDMENVKWPLFILLISSLFSMLLSPYSEVLQQNNKYRDLFYSGIGALFLMISLGGILKYVDKGSAFSFSCVYLTSYFALNVIIYLRANLCMR